MILSPVLQIAPSKFGSIVNSNLLRGSAFVFELFEDTDHSLTRQRRVHLNSQSFSIEMIDLIEGAKPGSVIETITHEVGPHA